MKKITLAILALFFININQKIEAQPCNESCFCSFEDSITLVNLVQENETIIEGKIVSKTPFQVDGNWYTSFVIDVYKSFKGEVKSKQIELIYSGARYVIFDDGKTTKSQNTLTSFANENLAIPTVNQTGLFYLIGSKENVNNKTVNEKDTKYKIKYFQGFELNPININAGIEFLYCLNSVGYETIEKASLTKTKKIQKGNPYSIKKKPMWY
jgi:hypothetical protein